RGAQAEPFDEPICSLSAQTVSFDLTKIALASSGPRLKVAVASSKHFGRLFEPPPLRSQKRSYGRNSDENPRIRDHPHTCADAYHGSGAILFRRPEQWTTPAWRVRQPFFPRDPRFSH